MRSTTWLSFPVVSPHSPQSRTQKADRLNPLARTVRLVSLAAVAFFAVQTMAQNSGTIQGTVTDAQGAVIAGASVQAIDQAKATVARQVTTSGDGLFVLQPLDPGIYTIR